MNVLKTVMLGLLIAAVYYLSGMAGAVLNASPQEVNFIWIAAGVAVAAVYQFGNAVLPFIFLAAFFVSYSYDANWVTAVPIATGNTLAAWAVVWLMRKWRFDPSFQRMSDVTVLVGAGALGMMISASLGSLSLRYIQSDFSVGYNTWFAWWVGDLVGMLLVAPVLLNATKADWGRLKQGDWRIYIALLLLAIAAELAIIYLMPEPMIEYFLMALTVLPLMIICMVRFGVFPTTLGIFALAITAIFARNHFQVLQHVQRDNSVFALWAFMAAMQMTVLLVNPSRHGREQAEKTLGGSEARYRAIVEGALDGIITVDAKGDIVDFNSAAAKIFGYQPEEVAGRSVLTVMLPAGTRDRYRDLLNGYIETGVRTTQDDRIEIEAIRGNEKIFPVEVSLARYELDGQVMVTGFVRDISERKQAEQQILNLGFFDSLTGLPNRRMLIDRLERIMLSAHRNHIYSAVLFLDLDNFKALNDTRGHDVGDMLLIAVADAIKSVVRENDTIARLGGDEFVVLLDQLGKTIPRAVTLTRMIADKVIEKVNTQFMLKGVAHKNSSSMGITLIMEDDKSALDVLKRADMAMYQAKAAGRNTLRFFDVEMQSSIDARLAMEHDLNAVLSKKQLQLYYQPQLDKNRKILGAEVLLRWIHPEHGFVPLDLFIPIAEESGQILSIGNWVLEQACRQLLRWNHNFYGHDIRLSVNVSGRQFKQPNFVEQVTDILRATSVDPRFLTLELTESVVMDDIHDIQLKMEALKKMGIQFSMDDFGTGYSSLAYLKQLPINEVKIDKAFVRDIAAAENAAAIINAIIAMSQALKLDIVAEGVETEEQFGLLQQFGCQIFQGYLFSKPVNVDAMDNLLRENRLLKIKQPEPPTDGTLGMQNLTN